MFTSKQVVMLAAMLAVFSLTAVGAENMEQHTASNVVEKTAKREKDALINTIIKQKQGIEKLTKNIKFKTTKEKNNIDGARDKEQPDVQKRGKAR
jgi:hypothetical protein